MSWAKLLHGHQEVEMAAFNVTWNRKDSAWDRRQPIEKADARHKRDLFKNKKI
jgi:hypothetical protein